MIEQSLICVFTWFHRPPRQSEISLLVRDFCLGDLNSRTHMLNFVLQVETFTRDACMFNLHDFFREVIPVWIVGFDNYVMHCGHAWDYYTWGFLTIGVLTFESH